MRLEEIIAKRKSVRKYKNVPLDDATLEKIRTFWENAKPLCPDLKVHAEFVERDKVRSLMSWLPPQVIAIYSEEGFLDLENVGFLFQQVDLYLQSLGLGSCWVGLGRPKGAAVQNKSKDQKFVILLTVGYPDEDFRSDISQFKRKSLAEISDAPDEKLEPARLAPSAVNSQPWYFVHDGNVFHLYRTKPGLIKGRSLNDFNRVDVGIVLAHMYAANSDTFRFWTGDHPERNGMLYVGSFEI